MVPRKSKSQVKRPAKKKVVNKADPKKGLAGAGDLSDSARTLMAFYEARIKQLECERPKTALTGIGQDTPDPLRVAIEKFSLSLVSEGMLAMVAMHGILTTNPSESTQSIARGAVETARAVMAELKKKEEGK